MLDVNGKRVDAKVPILYAGNYMVGLAKAFNRLGVVKLMGDRADGLTGVQLPRKKM